MTIREFRAEVIGELKKQYGERYIIQEMDVNKINRKEMFGICISEKNTTIAPVMYVENFYEAYQDGVSMDLIMEKIMDALNEETGKLLLQKDPVMLTDWESVKDNIRVRLVNTESNEEILKNLISVPVLNLSMIFYIKFLDIPNQIGTANITKNLFEKYHVELDELVSCAVGNEEKESCIKDMSTMLEELTGEDVGEMTDAKAGEDTPMLVLTNKDKMYGASAILSKKNRQKLIDACNGKDCYVLPSSLHEVIVVPSAVNTDSGEMIQMVKEVNSSCVEPDDFLADAVYMLHADTLEVEILEEE